MSVANPSALKLRSAHLEFANGPSYSQTNKKLVQLEAHKKLIGWTQRVNGSLVQVQSGLADVEQGILVVS